MIKNRYSKSKLKDSLQQNYIYALFNKWLPGQFTQKLFKPISKYIAPSYQQRSYLTAKEYNDQDINITQQYLNELENNRRNSIVAHSNSTFQSVDYYFDASQNHNMISLDWGSDGDIEEEPDDIEENLEELELKYDMNNDSDIKGRRRYSQEVDDYFIESNTRIQQTETIEEEDESDSSVITAVVSGDSNNGSRSSNSSPTAISVNSMSGKENSNFGLFPLFFVCPKPAMVLFVCCLLQMMILPKMKLIILMISIRERIP